jgi:hypothetical protein
VSESGGSKNEDQALRLRWVKVFHLPEASKQPSADHAKEELFHETVRFSFFLVY